MRTTLFGIALMQVALSGCIGRGIPGGDALPGSSPASPSPTNDSPLKPLRSVDVPFLGESVTPEVAEGDEPVITSTLRLVIEGYWNANTKQMSAALLLSNVSGASELEADFVTVELHDATNPSQIIESKMGCVMVDGTVIGACGDPVAQAVSYDRHAPPRLSFTQFSWNARYWLVVKHRSSIETWSKEPIAIPKSGEPSYDFTAANGAYCDNELEVSPGVYAIRSGDINRDGSVDASDFLVMQSALSEVATGYNVSDLTGDGVVESADYGLLDNGMQQGLGACFPAGIPGT